MPIDVDGVYIRETGFLFTSVFTNGSAIKCHVVAGSLNVRQLLQKVPPWMLVGQDVHG